MISDCMISDYKKIEINFQDQFNAKAHECQDELKLAFNIIARHLESTFRLIIEVDDRERGKEVAGTDSLNLGVCEGRR